jgi:hypothetical protein
VNYQTYGQVRTRVIQELDLGNESFIAPDEMVGFCNEALAEAEAEIHKINEDYFLKKATISLTLGQQLYSLPADIYANKIRQILYSNNAIIYPLRHIKRSETTFYDATVTDYFGAAQFYRYRYLIINSSAAAGMQIELHPPAVETGPLLQIWYLRSIGLVPLVSAGSQAASDAALIDVPEFYNFILHYMKAKCLEKDSDPRLETALVALEHQRKMMVDTLTQMIPDDDDTIAPDLSFYWDSE